MPEPVKPVTTSTPRAAAARAVSAMRSAARRRTPSGSPSPQTSAGSTARWRASIGSHTAWPTRWVLIAKHDSPWRSSSSRRPAQYESSASAAATSKWSPQHASSSPSYPHPAAFSASSASGRSAHWPVKSVIGRAMG